MTWVSEQNGILKSLVSQLQKMLNLIGLDSRNTCEYVFTAIHFLNEIYGLV